MHVKNVNDFMLHTFFKKNILCISLGKGLTIIAIKLTLRSKLSEKKNEGREWGRYFITYADRKCKFLFDFAYFIVDLKINGFSWI